MEIDVSTVQKWAVLNISVFFLSFDFFLSKISFPVFKLKSGLLRAVCPLNLSFGLLSFQKESGRQALLIFTKKNNYISLHISFRQIAKILFRFPFSSGRLRHSGGPYAVLFDGRLLLDDGRGNLSLSVYCKGLQRWQQVKNVPWNFMG